MIQSAGKFYVSPVSKIMEEVAHKQLIEFFIQDMSELFCKRMSFPIVHGGSIQYLAVWSDDGDDMIVTRLVKLKKEFHVIIGDTFTIDFSINIRQEDPILLKPILELSSL